MAESKVMFTVDVTYDHLGDCMELYREKGYSGLSMEESYSAMLDAIKDTTDEEPALVCKENDFNIREYHVVVNGEAFSFSTRLKVWLEHLWEKHGNVNECRLLFCENKGHKFVTRVPAKGYKSKSKRLAEARRSYIAAVEVGNKMNKIAELRDRSDHNNRIHGRETDSEFDRAIHEGGYR